MGIVTNITYQGRSYYCVAHTGRHEGEPCVVITQVLTNKGSDITEEFRNNLDFIDMVADELIKQSATVKRMRDNAAVSHFCAR